MARSALPLKRSNGNRAVFAVNTSIHLWRYRPAKSSSSSTPISRVPWGSSLSLRWMPVAPGMGMLSSRRAQPSTTPAEPWIVILTLSSPHMMATQCSSMPFARAAAWTPALVHAALQFAKESK